MHPQDPEINMFNLNVADCELNPNLIPVTTYDPQSTSNNDPFHLHPLTIC